MAKKKKTRKPIFIPLHIYGIFNEKNGEIIKVSLDLDDVMLDLALADEDDGLCQCEFDTILVL